jgi:hypothetical protein
MADIGARVVTSHRMIAVTEERFTIFGGDAGGAQAACERVTEVMHTYQGQASLVARLLPTVVIHPFYASAVVREHPDGMLPAL